jgi:myo-inositol-1(or 4)-monophosphatase
LKQGDVERYLEVTLDIAEEVRKIVEKYREKDAAKDIVRRKGADLTRKIDLIAERTVEEGLVNRGISAVLFSEESGVKIVGRKPVIFIVLDPLDGTTNFVNSIPFYCVSIALGEIKKKNPNLDDLLIGVVKDIVRKEEFYAVKNKGAFQNSRKIRVVKKRKFEKPLVSFYAYGVKEIKRSYFSLLRSMKTRTLGSTALELCYIASAKLDALVDVREIVRPTDLVAGKMILEEAGGVVTNLFGEKVSGTLGRSGPGISLVASKDEELHEFLLKSLKAKN